MLRLRDVPSLHRIVVDVFGFLPEHRLTFDLKSAERALPERIAVKTSLLIKLGQFARRQNPRHRIASVRLELLHEPADRLDRPRTDDHVDMMRHDDISVKSRSFEPTFPRQVKQHAVPCLPSVERMHEVEDGRGYETRHTGIFGIHPMSLPRHALL